VVEQAHEPYAVSRYETAYGLTDPVQILKGLGQGDLASPARAKQLLTVIAGAVDKARWEQWTWRGRTCSNVTLAQYTNARAVR